MGLVLEALAELRGEINELKRTRRRDSCASSAAGAGPSSPVAPVGSPAGSFRGFNRDRDSSEEGELRGDGPIPSVLQHSALEYGPVEEVSSDIDKHVADMVNHLFDHGLRDQTYKDIVEDELAKRPGNCPALIPVECNSQVLDAMKQDARKADFRMKEVNKDITKAAAILVKSLTALDNIAQKEGLPEVANEVGALNGALALLGHANYRNNLVRRFNVKRDINPKYSHLCSDKVPMTRFLFGDDVSQSTKQIEESEKLRNKFSTKKALPHWKPGVGRSGNWRSRGFFGNNFSRGYGYRFQPYDRRPSTSKGVQRTSYPRQELQPKNSRSRGPTNPRQ